MTKIPKIYIPCSWAKDLSNKKFNRLTALVPIGRYFSQIVWLCECSCGGSLVAVNSGALQQGNTKSCGCWKKVCQKKPFGQSAFSCLYNRYKARAKKRKIAFALTEEYFRKITSSKCFYCKVPPEMSMMSARNFFFGDYLYNGIDRVDHKKGYTKDNIVPCCGMCNRAKYVVGYKNFMKWIRRLRKGK